MIFFEVCSYLDYQCTNPLYRALDVLIDVPVNIWLWLLPFAAPILVFSANPMACVQKRDRRLIVATAITCVLLNLGLQTHLALRQREFEACRVAGGYHSDSFDGYEACKHLINMATARRMFSSCSWPGSLQPAKPGPENYSGASVTAGNSWSRVRLTPATDLAHC